MLLLFILMGVGFNIYQDKIMPKEHRFESYSLALATPSIYYQLENNDSKEKLRYEPNVHSFSEISVNTDIIGLTLAFQNNDEDKEDIGPSSLFDIQLFGKFKNHIWEAYYQNYQGLYITDKTDLEKNLASANSYSYGLSMKKFLRKSYKLKDSFAYFSKKKKSGWSPLLGVSINKSKLFRSKGLIPNEYAASYNQLIGLTAIESSSLGVEGGIAGLFSYRKFFIGGLISMGAQAQKQSFSGIDTKERSLTSTVSSVFVDLGYETNHIGTFGITIRANGVSIPVKNTQYNLTRSYNGFYYKYFF